MVMNINLGEISKGYSDDFRDRISKSPGFSGKFLNNGVDPAIDSASWADIWTDAMLIANHYTECTGFIVVPTNDPPVILMKGNGIKTNCGGSKLCLIGGADIVDKLGRSYKNGSYKYKKTGSEIPCAILPDKNWDSWVKDPQARPVTGCKVRNDGVGGVRRTGVVWQQKPHYTGPDWFYGANTVGWDRICSKVSKNSCGKNPNHRCKWWGSGGTSELTNFITAHRFPGCTEMQATFIPVPRGKNRNRNSLDHEINQNVYVLEKCATNCKADPDCLGVTVPHHTVWWAFNPKNRRPRRNENNCYKVLRPKNIKRQSGMTKATYDAVKKSYTSNKNDYINLKSEYKKFADGRVKNPISINKTDFNVYRDQVIAEGFISNTITQPNKSSQYLDIEGSSGQITDRITSVELKNQQDRLAALRVSELSESAEGFRRGLEDINKNVAELKILKNNLENDEIAIGAIIPGKELRIQQLEIEFTELNEDALAQKAHLTNQLEKLKQSIQTLKDQVLETKINIHDKEVEIADTIESLEQLSIQYNSLLINSRAMGTDIKTAENDVEVQGESNAGLKKTIELAPKILKIHEQTLARLKNDLLKYKKNPGREPIAITRLLNRSHERATDLFDEVEKKYNLNTARMNTRFMTSSPTHILYLNQKVEFDQNKDKLDRLKRDASTIHKDIQIKQNESRKRSYYLFILKIVFICTLFLLLIGLLMKNGNITKVLGGGLIGVVLLVLFVILFVNFYINSNRNRIFFNKRDWNSKIHTPDEKKTCEKLPSTTTETDTTDTTDTTDATDATDATDPAPARAGGPPECVKLCTKRPADCAELDGYLAPGGCAETCSEPDKSYLRASCQNM